MESKRSCCLPLKCCGIPIEKGCFIFSIINAIVCSLGFLASLSLLGFILYLWFNPDFVTEDVVADWQTLTISVAGCVGFAIALVFAVLLCLGVRKNKKRYIMAYLIHGMVSEVLGVLGTIVFIWFFWGQVHIMVYAMIPLGVGVIYSFMMLLVYRTYVVFSERDPITGHTRLHNID